MKCFRTIVWSLLFLVVAPARHASAATPSNAAATSAAGELLAADTPRTTADGHGFIAPAGWSIRTIGAALILTAPEQGSRVALVDVAAHDADTAVAAAWAAYDAKAKPQLERADDRPARNGWQQIRAYRYQTTGKVPRVLAAQARQHGERWTVAILDMTQEVLARRDAQLELLYGSLVRRGYVPETFTGRTANVLDAARLDALRQFVDDTRQRFGVPGVALGIVQGGKVVLAQGFGVRERGKPAPVEAQTLFKIASNTKPLTTLMLAKLVEAGKFSWDTPVTAVLPTFKLGDADTTRRVRMRHLVCACTGLPRQDMESTFESEAATPATMLATLATMQPTSGFGELYQYSNAIVAAAGYVGAHALYPQRELGAGYDAAMQTLVFDPLGMTATTFDMARALRANHAAPHAEDVDGRIARVSMDFQYTDIPSRPDGGAWSNVPDLLRYVQMELDRGLLPDGTRYIAQAPLMARREPQVARGNDQGYGLGLKVDRTAGALLLHHGGSMFGYISDVMWLPEHDVGAVILSNGDGGAIYLRSLFRRRLLELLFDGEPLAAATAVMQERSFKTTLAATREALTVPADATVADALARRYRSAALGSIAVSRRGEALWFDVGGWRSEMATRRDDDGTIVLVTISPGLVGGLEFAVADHGRRALRLRDEQHEYVFVEAD